MTCSPKDITADDNTDFEDISRYDVGMLPLLTRPCTSRFISRLDSCLRLVTLRLVLGLAHVRKSTLPSRHFSLAPPFPPHAESFGVVTRRPHPRLCASCRPFYACHEHRFFPQLHGGVQPTDIEHLVNKNLSVGYFCDACGVMHQNGRNVRACSVAPNILF